MKMTAVQFNKIISANFFAACLLLLFYFTPAHSSEDINIIITVSNNSTHQLHAASEIKQQLSLIKHSATVVTADELDTNAHTGKSVYVLIGQSSYEAFEASGIEAPYLRVSNYKTTTAPDNTRHAYLVLEQQRCREIKLIKALDNNWQSIAVLSNTSSIDKTTELTKCALEFGYDLSIYAINNSKDLSTILEKAIDDNDIILSIADPLIYNRHTIKNILLSSYRSRRPIIAYSKSFIEAGAIAGIYTSVEITGKTAANIISDFINNDWKFDKTFYYPLEFSVGTNRRVARSLEVELPKDTQILNTILDMESR